MRLIVFRIRRPIDLEVVLVGGALVERRSFIGINIVESLLYGFNFFKRAKFFHLAFGDKPGARHELLGIAFSAFLELIVNTDGRGIVGRHG